MAPIFKKKRAAAALLTKSSGSSSSSSNYSSSSSPSPSSPLVLTGSTDREPTNVLLCSSDSELAECGNSNSRSSLSPKTDVQFALEDLTIDNHNTNQIRASDNVTCEYGTGAAHSFKLDYIEANIREYDEDGDGDEDEDNQQNHRHRHHSIQKDQPALVASDSSSSSSQLSFHEHPRNLDHSLKQPDPYHPIHYNHHHTSEHPHLHLHLSHHLHPNNNQHQNQQKQPQQEQSSINHHHSRARVVFRLDESPSVSPTSSSSKNSFSHEKDNANTKKNSGKLSIDKSSEEYKKRRERNNIAVRKSRSKSKVKFIQTIDRMHQLEDEKNRLHQHIEKMRHELQLYRCLFYKYFGEDGLRLLKMNLTPSDLPNEMLLLEPTLDCTDRYPERGEVGVFASILPPWR